MRDESDERYVIRFTDTGKFNQYQGYEVTGLQNASFYYTRDEALKVCETLIPPFEILPVSELVDPEADNLDLTTEEAAKLLGISSEATIKNWLHGGHFPGAYTDRVGAWRFPLVEVRKTVSMLKDIELRNKLGDISPRDSDDDSEPQLL